MKRYAKTMLAAGAAVVLLVVVAAAANAQNGRMALQARNRARAAAIMRPAAWLRGLDLTAEQKDQIKTILANHKTEFQAVRQAGAEARKALRTAIADGADTATIKAAYDRVSSAGWDAFQLRMTLRTEIKGILTPEQLAKLEKRMNRIRGGGPGMLHGRIR